MSWSYNPSTVYYVVDVDFISGVYGTTLDEQFELTYIYVAQVGHEYNRGSWVKTVTSTDINAYPANGMSGSYWYVRQT